jgi:cold-inducible RNA-binding protein
VYPGLSNHGGQPNGSGAARHSQRLGAPGKKLAVAKKLFVGNLDFSTSENDLRDLFAQQGSVASADIVLDRMTGRSRGFGFVTYDSDEDAQRAIGALDGTDLNGRRISVSVARERGDSPGGGRSFGGQRGGRPGGGRGERR